MSPSSGFCSNCNHITCWASVGKQVLCQTCGTDIKHAIPCPDCAALREQLAQAQQRIAVLEAALRPFAEYYAATGDGPPGGLCLATSRSGQRDPRMQVPYTALRDAHTALAGEGESDEKE